MALKQILETIKGIRDRESLSTLINAAEARDSHLASIEADERKKRLWSKFSHLKKGDTVFVHRVVEYPLKYRNLYGKVLKVKQVKPRSKEIVIGVSGQHTVSNRRWPGDNRITLTAHVADSLALSERPTAEAVTNVISPESND